jgi:histidyl-tRNA synthetase
LISSVKEELSDRGVSATAIAKLQPIMDLKGTNEEKLLKLKDVLKSSETGLLGISETETILNYAKSLSVGCKLEFDLTLARGLNYYTGAIFEVKSLDAEMGSISGGGRYDNLTGVFGMEGVSGVGISFGADRIYDVLLQLNKFPASTVATTKALFVNFGSKEEAFCLPIVNKLRQKGVSCEIFPEAAKMKKQMGYADAKKIPFVVIVGENEMNSGLLTVKNMESGEQMNVKVEELLNNLSSI